MESSTLSNDSMYGVAKKRRTSLLKFSMTRNVNQTRAVRWAIGMESIWTR